MFILHALLDGNDHYLATDDGSVIIWENNTVPGGGGGGSGLSAMSGLSGESGMISI